MTRIIPPARPHRDRERLARLLTNLDIDANQAVIVFVRGHYLDSMGVKSVNDYNIYDDSAYLIADNFRTFESWNANTDPSFAKRGGRRFAKINAGVYRFYQGKHKSQYNALRAHPEGVRIPCTREGEASTAQYINIHKGGTNPRSVSVTHSEGCLTIPDTQYADFISRVYQSMDRRGQRTIPVILVENKPTRQGQRWHDASGRVVA
jgi:lysozyme